MSVIRSAPLRAAAIAMLAGSLGVFALGGGRSPARATAVTARLATLVPGRLLGTRVVGTAPRVPLGSRRVGAVPAGARLSLDVFLRPRDPAALERFALAVSSPSSRLYRHYLPRGRFASEFGPTPAAIASVRHALGLAGLRAGAATANGLIIPVTANAAQVERAFGSPLDRFRLPGGRVAMANTAPLTIDASASRYVQGVIGLDGIDVAAPAGLVSSPLRRHARVVRPRVAAPRVVGTPAGPAPCSGATMAAADNEAYTIDQIAGAYSFNGLYQHGDLGAGSTIALFELEPYMASDIAAYQACYRTHTSITNELVDGGAGKGFGTGEAALDIDVVIGLAPRARILVYEAPYTDKGTVDEYARIVSDDKAQVVSTSWGQCEADLPTAVAAAEATIFEEAAAQGQSVFAAAGDVGSEDCYFDSGAVSAAQLPLAVAVDPGTGTVYSVNSSGTLTVTSEKTVSTARVVRLGAGTDPVAVAVDPVSHMVFVSSPTKGSILYLNGSTCNAARASTAGCHVASLFLAARSHPAGIAVDPRTRTVYVASPTLGAIAVLSEKGTRLRYVAEAPGGRSPSAVAVDTRTDQVFFTTTSGGASYVDRINGSTCDAARTSGCAARANGRRVGRSPAGVAVSATLGHLYVANSVSDTISVLGVAGGAAASLSLQPLLLNDPIGVSLSPSGDQLLVACAGAKGIGSGVAVVSLSPLRVETVIPAGNQPVAVASDPTTGNAWIANRNGGQLIYAPLELSVDDPGSQQFVTSVGGTTLSSTSPRVESVWNDIVDESGATGGGVSKLWRMPSYQTGPGVVSRFSSGVACGLRAGDCREVPDVSASADPYDGYTYYYAQTWSGLGGTSGAAPLWASLAALVDVYSGSLHPIGFVNPALYSLVASGAKVVNDVTVGDNDYTGTGGGLYPATPGFDMASGLGTPIAPALATALAGSQPPAVSSP
jgi:DNA-binding beta-propeller fold protein YncE